MLPCRLEVYCPSPKGYYHHEQEESPSQSIAHYITSYAEYAAPKEGECYGHKGLEIGTLTGSL